MKRFLWLYGWMLLVWVGCEKGPEPAPTDPPFSVEIPVGFPPFDVPEGNEMTRERVELGKKLFHDPILSVDRSISCASCHLQEFAFADTARFSRGVEGRLGFRNSPSLLNVAYQPALLREGGVPTLEMQVLVPIQEHSEFDFNILLVAERMLEDSTYVQLSQAAYDRAPDAFVITRSISAFERTLLSGNSPYDQYHFQGKEAALTNAQKRGMQLFFSEQTNCSACHSDFNFTNYAYENNGLYEVYADSGRARLTLLAEDRARFKVPSLRNVALTAPYMHDGSMPSLEAVIEHYVSGGKAHENKSELIRPLALSASEKQDLIAFLEALTEK